MVSGINPSSSKELLPRAPACRHPATRVAADRPGRMAVWRAERTAGGSQSMLEATTKPVLMLSSVPFESLRVDCKDSIASGPDLRTTLTRASGTFDSVVASESERATSIRVSSSETLPGPSLVTATVGATFSSGAESIWGERILAAIVDEQYSGLGLARTRYTP